MNRRELLFASMYWGAAGYVIQQNRPVVNQDDHGMPAIQANVDRASQALVAAPPGQSIPVLTRSYDNLRTCANPRETILTPANVSGLRQLFTVVLPGDARGCEAQPLIIPSIRVADNTVHDLLIACTMANQVWAFDADTGTPLWMRRIGGNPVAGSRNIDAWLINQNWGILSTPVVDIDNQILYCVSWSSPDGNWQRAAHRVHALRLSDGADVKTPLDLSNVVYNPGNGLPTQSFKASERKQRAALTLATVGGRKTLFIPFGTILETSDAARGWIVAVDLTSWLVSASWTASSKYSGGGIWQAGQGLAAVDSAGFLYTMTGNGAFDGVSEWGECFLKLRYVFGTPGRLEVVDWWSPFSDSGRAGQNPSDVRVTGQNAWDDMDLGSGGVSVIPDLGLILGAGKDGILYVMNVQNMGKTKPSDFATPASNYAKLMTPPIWYTFYPGPGVSAAPNRYTDLNKLYFGRTHHQHSSSVVWQSEDGWRLFCWGENGNLRAWSIDATGVARFLGNGAEVSSPQAPASPGGMPGGMMSLSANGGKDGILWAIVPDGDANKTITPGKLYAYDAQNFGRYPDGNGSIRLLWQAPIPAHPKFNVPVVSAGKVYVPSYNGSIIVYGL